MLKLLNNPITAAITLAAFLALAQYSLNYKTESQAAFVERKLATYEAEKKRAQIMDIYNLTEADIAKPVELWR